MQHLLLIAVGGMLGALSRYALSKWIYQAVNDLFPWGTLAINLSGSLLIGIFFELFDQSVIPSDLRSLITIGFLGAYTTFSTYSLETVNLLREGEIRLCLTNVVLSNVLGLMLVIMGMQATRILLKIAR
jgi:CrcB protein